MKVLLLFPAMYTFANSINSGFEKNGCEVFSVDYRDLVSNIKNLVYNKTSGLPYKYKRYFYDDYVMEINKKYLKLVKKNNIDLVFVYNNQLLLPETIKRFPKSTRLGFYLGDNPLYSHTSSYNLTILQYADFIISPDSFWNKQLTKIGISNIKHDVFGFDSNSNYIINRKEENYKNDLIFIGGNYPGAAGYKRSMFLNGFSDLDIAIYGTNKAWEKWFKFFPKLKKRVTLTGQRLPFEEVNLLMNKAKVYPIENNPGAFNGVHLRVWECIGSGVLPLPEYSSDLEVFFKDTGIPSITDYRESAEIAKYFLEDDQLRKGIISKLRKHVIENQMPEHTVSRILTSYIKRKH